MLQKTLASQLGLSPTAMNEIFQERNNPSCEVGLHMLEILKETFMTQTPALNRRPIVIDDDDDDLGNMSEPPRTLAQANARLIHSQETISRLQKEVASLRAAALPAPNPQSLPPKLPAAPAIRTATPAASKPVAPTPSSSTGMIYNPENPVTEIDRLRVSLNKASNQEEKGILYRKIKALEAEQSGSPRRARLRGL